MFGRHYEGIATTPQVNLSGQKISVPTSNLAENKILMAEQNNSLQTKVVAPAKLDPFLTTRTVGVSIFAIISLLLILDFIILKKRGVFRLSSHHFAHLSFLAVAGASLILSSVGEIL
jgi:hypothetical protein